MWQNHRQFHTSLQVYILDREPSYSYSSRDAVALGQLPSRVLPHTACMTTQASIATDRAQDDFSKCTHLPYRNQLWSIEVPVIDVWSNLDPNKSWSRTKISFIHQYLGHILEITFRRAIFVREYNSTDLSYLTIQYMAFKDRGGLILGWLLYISTYITCGSQNVIRSLYL